MIRAACLVLAAAAALGADGKFTDFEYLGGAPGVHGKRLGWNNTLEVSPGRIRIAAGDEVLCDVDPKNVTALTYEGFRNDNLGAQAAIGIPGLWPKTTEHLLIVEYRTPAGRTAEVLLRAHKKSYKEILQALRSATGK